VNHITNLQNLRNSYTSLRELLTKQLPLKDKEKKLASLPKYLARLREPLFKYQHQDWMLEE
jgi:hypothetical protein